jgi:exopolysaccharide biosynthesis polyprenyl glycosylphosphotransferase
MTADEGQRSAEPALRPLVTAPATRAGGRGSTGGGHGGRRRGHLVPAAALPLADLLGLAAAAGITRHADPATGLYALAVLTILAAGGQHRLRICLRVSDQVGRILAAAVFPLPVLLLSLPAGEAVWFALWSAGLITAARAAMCAALRAAHRRGLFTEPALVVGSGTFGAYVADLMRDHPELGLRPQGFLDDGPGRRDLALPTLGHPADLAEVSARLGIRRVVVCWAICRDEDLVEIVRASRPLRADVCVVPRFYELGVAVPRACLDEIWGIPLIPLRRFGHAPPGLLLKRAFDVAAAAVLLAVASPLLLALALAIRLRTGRSPLFRQARVTGRGRVTDILKLRTLREHDDPDTRWTPVPALTSPLGRWLRARHVDELPQLVNVLRGDMSLVGPRPERPYFAERFGREIPRYADRTRTPAGITGWAQVNGLTGDTSLYERVRFDNQYIEYWSPWLDLAILARTLAAVVRAGRGGGR